MREDREYIILKNIEKNERISQRELSKVLGISLGSVNMLLGKMMERGLIKAKTIPAKRAAYMLTPKGMMEKADKTYRYIKKNYNYINSTKEKIKDNLTTLLQEEEQVILLLQHDEIGELVKKAVDELSDARGRNLKIIYGKEELLEADPKAFIVTTEKVRSKESRMMNLLERI